MTEALDDEDVRLAIYHAFAASGRAPTIPELTQTFAASDAQIREVLRRLVTARHLVLDDADAVVMAHPFTSTPLGFSVMGAKTLWWGGCAWDSFALPHLLPAEPDVLVATRCPGCGQPHAWVVNRDAPPPGTQLAHFLVPAAQIWDDVVHTCRHQRIFCDQRCIDAWLHASNHQQGYVLDLPTLWRLARGWYAGRLDHGYQRRDPTTAAAYFRDVGLHGSFWGLAPDTGDPR